ncbi:MAG: ankyrin repeat domain-containing protein, partial [Thermoanaerobaculia bacterium]
MENDLVELIFKGYQKGGELSYELINKLYNFSKKNRKKLSQREKDDLGEKLLESCKSKNIKCSIEAILQGASVNFKDIEGNTPLLEAVRNDDIFFLKILLHLKAEPDVLNDLKESPIILAVEKGNKEILKTLIDNACDLNLKNSRGKTPLILAIE